MLNSAEWMSDLVQGLLRYSRISRAELKVINVKINDVIEAAIKQLEIHINEANATVTIEGLGAIHGDRILLTQLFMNLLSNSLKYRKYNQPCVIQIHISDQPSNGEREDSYIICTIEDNGIGVSKEYEEKIFQMFEREKQNQSISGIGIGLSICRQIMSKHEGRIYCSPSHLGGAKMHLEFIK